MHVSGLLHPQPALKPLQIFFLDRAVCQSLPVLSAEESTSVLAVAAVEPPLASVADGCVADSELSAATAAAATLAAPELSLIHI